MIKKDVKPRTCIATSILSLVFILFIEKGFATEDKKPNYGEICVKDLEFIPGFLIENDTGAKAHLEQFGQHHFDEAFRKAKLKAEGVTDRNECMDVIQEYFQAWRKGHLFVSPINKDSEENKNSFEKQENTLPRMPVLEFLSSQTLLFKIDSFFGEYKEHIDTLITENIDKLNSTPHWIIDVRNNNGGTDATYASLIPWIMNDEYTMVAIDWLATEANIKAQASVCDRHQSTPQCQEWMSPLVAQLEEAEPNTYVVHEKHEPVFYERADEPKSAPKKIAVLIDTHCGSSCEQFLLLARQSFKVKLLGRKTHGALDYSNLRPKRLPSGEFDLYYATSRSLRLPHLPVDNIGILPDIYLEKTDDQNHDREEILRVQRWLEGGSLARQ